MLVHDGWDDKAEQYTGDDDWTAAHTAPGYDTDELEDEEMRLEMEIALYSQLHFEANADYCAEDDMDCQSAWIDNSEKLTETEQSTTTSTQTPVETKTKPTKKSKRKIKEDECDSVPVKTKKKKKVPKVANSGDAISQFLVREPVVSSTPVVKSSKRSVKSNIDISQFEVSEDGDVHLSCIIIGSDSDSSIEVIEPNNDSCQKELIEVKSLPKVLPKKGLFPKLSQSNKEISIVKHDSEDDSDEFIEDDEFMEDSDSDMLGFLGVSAGDLEEAGLLTNVAGTKRASFSHPAEDANPASHDDVDMETATLQQIHNSLPECDWTLNSRDISMSMGGKGRYYKEPNVTCHNCNTKGHLSKSCPKPKKAQICYLCSESGHTGYKCPRPQCFNCDHVGHIGRDCPKPWKNARKHNDCRRCNMRGHDEEFCTDLWRQFHLTIKSGPLKQGKFKPNPRKRCYNCSSVSHFGFECPKGPDWRYNSVPGNPFITRYDAANKLEVAKPRAPWWELDDTAKSKNLADLASMTQNTSCPNLSQYAQYMVSTPINSNVSKKSRNKSTPSSRIVSPIPKIVQQFKDSQTPKSKKKSKLKRPRKDRLEEPEDYQRSYPEEHFEIKTHGKKRHMSTPHVEPAKKPKNKKRQNNKSLNDAPDFFQSSSRPNKNNTSNNRSFEGPRRWADPFDNQQRSWEEAGRFTGTHSYVSPQLGPYRGRGGPYRGQGGSSRGRGGYGGHNRSPETRVDEYRSRWKKSPKSSRGFKY